jgi:hypothetical protein
VLTAMPKKTAGGKVWHGVQTQHALCVKGGYLREPTTIEVVEYEYDGGAVRCTPISSQLQWLCQMAAGKCKSVRPLGRCLVFRVLHRKVMEAAGVDDTAVAATDDKMAALAFDEGPPMDDAARTPRGKSTAKRNAKTTTVAAPIVAEVTVKDCPSAVAESRRVIAVVHNKSLYLEVNGLSWLANFLREELPTGGVEPVPDEGPRNGPNIFWDWRDEVWVRRHFDSNGSRRRQSKPVRSRMAKGGDLSHLDFEAAKQYVYDEFEQQLSTHSFDTDDATLAESGESQSHSS